MKIWEEEKRSCRGKGKKKLRKMEEEEE